MIGFGLISRSYTVFCLFRACMLMDVMENKSDPKTPCAFSEALLTFGEVFGS